MTTPTNTAHPSWLQEAAMKILGIGESFWAFIWPTVRADTQSLLVQLAPIAVSVVKSLVDQPQDGEAKRQAAIGLIKSQATDAGIQCGASIVNLAIEYAVQSLAKK